MVFELGAIADLFLGAHVIAQTANADGVPDQWKITDIESVTWQIRLNAYHLWQSPF